MTQRNLFVALVVLLACSLPLTGSRATAAEPASYTLVYLKSGPQSGKLPEADNKAAFAGHFANMAKLAGERKLLVAGPFGKERHDPDLRGIFVLATAKREEAEAWAGTDPTVKAGIFVLEYHDLSTAKNLAAALERHYANEAKAREEGREPKLEETMRTYVWLIAAERDKAKGELAPLQQKGQVFLVGELGQGKLLALLDAENAEAARAKYGEVLGKLGAYSLDDWYGSNELQHD